MGVVYMDKRSVALSLWLAMLLVLPICSAQSAGEDEQVWLPPSWVFGTGYAPYDYPGSMYYDPFIYYGYQGKTYYPYGHFYYYYPGSIWYYSRPHSFYGGYWYS